MRTKKEQEEVQKADKLLNFVDKFGQSRWLAPAIILIIGIVIAIVAEILTS